MKHTVFLYGILVLFSCNTKHNSSNKQENDTASKKSNPTILNQEELSIKDSNLIKRFLNDPNLDKRIKDYLNGDFKLSDDDIKTEFLDLITKKNDKYFPINFYIFNEICENSDGALSEMLGDYCWRIIFNYPNEVFRELSINPTHLLLYADLLGYELYFKSKGTSDLEIDYNEFKEFLSKKLNLSDKSINITYNKFCTRIDSVMQNMD